MKKINLIKIKKNYIKYKKLKIIIKKNFHKKKINKVKIKYYLIIKFINIINKFNLIKKHKNYKNIINIERLIKKKLIKKNKKEEIILEIKNGVGGEESAIFNLELSKMYMRFFEKLKWKINIVCVKKSKLGYRNITIKITGKKSYNIMKKEFGIHRVQRNPKTENTSKIHTSTCKIYIIPIIKNKKLIINKKDLKIDTFKSSGSGGQHVNTTDSAVRIKHLCTGIVAESQSERSQHKNKKIALEIIKNKILMNKKKIYNENIKKLKKKYLNIGKRAEKIRTYNFIKNTFINHIKNIKLNNLNWIMQGNLKKLLKQ